jgi:hypothetical protein
VAFKLTYRDEQADDYDENTKRELEVGVSNWDARLASG